MMFMKLTAVIVILECKNFHDKTYRLIEMLYSLSLYSSIEILYVDITTAMITAIKYISSKLKCR